MFVRRSVSLAVLAALAACSPTSKATGDDTGSEGGSSSQGEGTTGPGLACEDYRSAAEVGPAVSVTIRHEGTTPLYVVPVGCGGAIPIAITTRPGDQEVPYHLGECSPVLCDDFLGATDCQQGCNDCVPPGAARIDPGATGEGSWSGAWLVPLEMSSTCAAGEDCATTCQRQDAAPPGRYQVGLTIYNTCIGGCECEEGSSGVCSLFGGTQLGYPQTFVTEIDYPAETVAELVLVD